MPHPGFPTLDTATLAPAWPRRSVPPGLVAASAADMARYDHDTLWYDAFWKGGDVRLVCPRFHGLDRLLAEGRFSAEGARPRRVHRRVYPWYEVLRLTGLPRGRRIDFSWDGMTVGSAVSDAEADAMPFQGLNVAVTLNQDNALTWIEDWALWHVRHHGLQAVLMFDNGSTQTTLAEVHAALMRTGLRHAAVVDAPLPYGLLLRTPDGKSSHAGKYLQTSILNIARLRFLCRARAVLLCDIDELVRPDHGSVFDATRRSVLGLQVLSGSWRYPAGGTSVPARHGDHALESPSDAPFGGKYCISPAGLLSGLSWSVHRPESRFFGSRPRPQRHGFWHCWGVTTNTRRMQQEPPGDLRVDPQAQAALGSFAWSAGSGTPADLRVAAHSYE